MSEKTKFFSALLAIVLVASLIGGAIAGLVGGNQSSILGGSTSDSWSVGGDLSITGASTFTGAITAAALTLSGAFTGATTTVENLTTGGQACSLTDANGGTYTLSAAELAQCGTLDFAASGAGQEVIALTSVASSSVTAIPNAGDCKEFTYSADALAIATTTTFTAAAGFHLIAATTNDDVIDGDEFSQWEMCRRSDTDINWFVTENVHSD